MAPYALIENRLDQAIQELEESIRDNPSDPRAHNWLGIALSRKGLYERAIGCFDQAVSLAPSNERYWYNQGAAYAAAGRPLRAARYFQMAVRLSPGYERAQEALSSLRASHPEIPVADLAPGSAASAVPELAAEALIAGPATAEYAAPVELAPIRAAAVPGSPLPLEWPVGSSAFGPWSAAGRCPGVWTRLVSTLIDLAVIQVAWLAAIVVVNAVEQLVPALPAPSAPVLMALGCLCVMVLNGCLTGYDGRTVGKRITRTRVVDRAGFEPSRLQSLLRIAAYPLHIPTLGLSYVWMHRRPGSRALHDRASSTYVVGRRLDPSSAFVCIFTLAGANLLLAAYLYFQVWL
ncbi:MAG: tetratricopeptide repeat protein [Chloroflexi bacterium]|nr:tetratricopeptide repeat protein [Chloroflexota bacterium]